jgi:hypothetical protein
VIACGAVYLADGVLVGVISGAQKKFGKYLSFYRDYFYSRKRFLGSSLEPAQKIINKYL